MVMVMAVVMTMMMTMMAALSSLSDIQSRKLGLSHHMSSRELML